MSILQIVCKFKAKFESYEGSDKKKTNIFSDL